MQNLPTSILTEILSELPLLTIRSFALTSRKTEKDCKHDFLWNKRYKKDFPFKRDQEVLSYFERYCLVFSYRQIINPILYIPGGPEYQKAENRFNSRNK